MPTYHTYLGPTANEKRSALYNITEWCTLMKSEKLRICIGLRATKKVISIYKFSKFKFWKSNYSSFLYTFTHIVGEPDSDLFTAIALLCACAAPAPRIASVCPCSICTFQFPSDVYMRRSLFTYLWTPTLRRHDIKYYFPPFRIVKKRSNVAIWANQI